MKNKCGTNIFILMFLLSPPQVNMSGAKKFYTQPRKVPKKNSFGLSVWSREVGQAENFSAHHPMNVVFILSGKFFCYL